MLRRAPSNTVVMRASLVMVLRRVIMLRGIMAADAARRLGFQRRR